jgi:hypothetical protein
MHYAKVARLFASYPFGSGIHVKILSGVDNAHTTQNRYQ